MLRLLEFPKRLRLAWHEWWMATHMECAESAGEDMWKFLEVGNPVEAQRLGMLETEESKRAARHADHVLDLLADLS